MPFRDRYRDYNIVCKMAWMYLGCNKYYEHKIIEFKIWHDCLNQKWYYSLYGQLKFNWTAFWVWVCGSQFNFPLINFSRSLYSSRHLFEKRHRMDIYVRHFSAVSLWNCYFIIVVKGLLWKITLKFEQCLKFNWDYWRSY